MKLSNNKILRIGVTGGIGSGKSTLCSAFVKFGLPVLYADEISKEICIRDSAVKKQLKKLFGEYTYNLDGSLNKQLIAKKIFADATLRKKMENIVHPKVEKEIEKRLNEISKNGKQIAVIEAALIYEAKLDNNLDAVIVVDADENKRINRIRKRDVVSEETVRKRMSAQMSTKEKVKKADFVVFNNGTVEELELKAQFLYNLFNKIICEGKSA